MQKEKLLLNSFITWNKTLPCWNSIMINNMFFRRSKSDNNYQQAAPRPHPSRQHIPSTQYTNSAPGKYAFYVHLPTMPTTSSFPRKRRNPVTPLIVINLKTEKGEKQRKVTKSDFVNRIHVKTRFAKEESSLALWSCSPGSSPIYCGMPLVEKSGSKQDSVQKS